MDKTKDIVEKPLEELVQLLRDYGFNTTCSCGHLPKPYIQMEWYDDTEITKLYNLLLEHKYKNFLIKAIWSSLGPDHGNRRARNLEIVFCPKRKLAKLEDIKEKEVTNEICII